MPRGGRLQAAHPTSALAAVIPELKESLSTKWPHRGFPMLNKLDDFPIHQTPEPIAHPATSDRNVYDRTWFNGYAHDGSYYFGIGMAVYPHRGIMDCAFSTVQPDGRQHCFYGSRRAPIERTDMQVGPFRMEVIEPMR